MSAVPTGGPTVTSRTMSIGSSIRTNGWTPSPSGRLQIVTKCRSRRPRREVAEALVGGRIVGGHGHLRPDARIEVGREDQPRLLELRQARVHPGIR